ncbi:MAG: MBL fold metallo-hydrolase [Candidatus Thorarchaeota archaeon]
MAEEYSAHIEIVPKVHLIRGKNQGRFPEANALLIDDEILTIVDAGASLDNIKKTVHDCGHGLEDIDQIILTHFHVDHKGHAAEIMKVADCELICHPLAKKGIETLEGTIEFYGIAGHRQFSNWRHLIDLRLPHVTGNYQVTSVFDDRKPISLGEIELVPIHAPGHTKDHTLFGINGTDIIFLVDIDLTRFGPWYGNAVSEVCAFQDSIRHVIELEPMVGISSHIINPIEENLIQRLEQYLAIFKQRENRIIENIKHGINTIEGLSKAPTIYPRIPTDAYLIFEEFMIEKHIDDMIRTGKVYVEEGVIHLR